MADSNNAVRFVQLAVVPGYVEPTAQGAKTHLASVFAIDTEGRLWWATVGGPWGLQPMPVEPKTCR